MKVKFHDLAKAIAKREGKKKQVDIAQIKEILKAIAVELANNERYSWSDVLAFFEKYLGKK